MEKYTYLLINFFTIIICFIFSFHPKIRFYKHFLPFIKASILVAIPFILWDAWFTRIGVWWFNDSYLIGIRFLNLPIEEWLFFICIPFSCVFTYHCLDKFFHLDWNKIAENYFFTFSIMISLTTGLIHIDYIYTSFTFFSVAASIFSLKFLLKVNWLGKASLIYTILLPGFFLVNGVLTGTGLENPIVNYNSGNFLDIRLLTIPIEDAVYGYTLIIWNLYFFKKFSTSSH